MAGGTRSSSTGYWCSIQSLIPPYVGGRACTSGPGSIHVVDGNSVLIAFLSDLIDRSYSSVLEHPS
jgi:hypothetical protein